MYSHYLKREIDPDYYNPYVDYESSEGIVYEEWYSSQIGFGFEFPDYESDLAAYQAFKKDCQKRLDNIEYRLRFEKSLGFAGYFTHEYGHR